jgi:hypothetical protein
MINLSFAADARALGPYPCTLVLAKISCRVRTIETVHSVPCRPAPFDSGCDQGRRHSRRQAEQDQVDPTEPESLLRRAAAHDDAPLVTPQNAPGRPASLGAPASAHRQR